MTIDPNSRYSRGEQLSAPSYSYGADGTKKYLTDDKGNPTDVLQVDHRNGVYLLTTLPLPESPQIQIMARETDNITLLAHDSLRDPTKWWVVADANPQIRHPLDLKTGDVVLLPT